MPGHVFVVKGDISTISCDAWAMSADGRTRSLPHLFFRHTPHRIWISNYVKSKLESYNPRPTSVCDFHSLKEEDIPIIEPRCSRVNHIVLNNGENSPKLYSVDVTTKIHSDGIEWQIDSSIVALNWMSHDFVNKKKPLNNRSKFLFALPVFGTGFGGSIGRTGYVLEQLLELLLEKARNTEDYDIILCCYDSPTFIAAQKYRLDNRDKFFECFVNNPPCQMPSGYSSIFDITKYLAEMLSKDKLVLFLGNEISTAAGILDWENILDKIAEEVGLNLKTHPWEVDNMSKVEIIELKCKKYGKDIRDLIAKHLLLNSNSLQNLLIAGLHCKEVVTTNYDCGYEDSVELQLEGNDKLSVIPLRIIKDTNQWLLKLNGCVSKPSSIVVTRKDYLRYMETNAAFAGIVQAKMMTSQFLFIGFSMEDENFHKIMDSVFKAKRNQSSVGISLQPIYNQYSAEIWNPSIESLCMRNNLNNDKKIKQEAIREVEKVLDLLLVQSGQYNSGYLLDMRFEETLSDEERELKKHLIQLSRSLNVPRKKWPMIMEMFSKYGLEYEANQITKDLLLKNIKFVLKVKKKKLVEQKVNDLIIDEEKEENQDNPSKEELIKENVNIAPYHKKYSQSIQFIRSIPHHTIRLGFFLLSTTILVSISHILRNK